MTCYVGDEKPLKLRNFDAVRGITYVIRIDDEAHATLKRRIVGTDTNGNTVLVHEDIDVGEQEYLNAEPLLSYTTDDLDLITYLDSGSLSNYIDVAGLKCKQSEARNVVERRMNGWLYPLFRPFVKDEFTLEQVINNPKQTQFYYLPQGGSLLRDYTAALHTLILIVSTVANTGISYVLNLTDNGATFGTSNPIEILVLLAKIVKRSYAHIKA